MLKIYDSLKSLATPELISKAAATLGEDNSKVSSAVSVIIPSLLGRILKEGNTPKLREIAEIAGKKKVINQLDNVFSGHGIFDGINVGERFENALVGTNNKGFFSGIASKTGINESSADRLNSWVAAMVAGFIGDKIVNGKETLPDILAQLGNEKSAIGADIPSGIAASMGLSKLFEEPVKKTQEKAREIPEKKKGGSGWITWLLIILLLLLLLFFWWRSCNKHKVPYDIGAHRITEKVEDGLDKLGAAAEGAVDVTTDALRSAADWVEKEFTLPDGRKIVAREGGFEETMLAYLKSEEYKNATAEELKDKWFHFDNIEFKFGSASELEKGSQQQLDNIAAILKNYPDVNIRIGAYADHIGSNEANLKITEKRANFIKSELVKDGVVAGRIDTQGFGEEFAHYPASAPDSLRKNDRHIAMRFTKK